MTKHSKLFEPITIGTLSLRNRVAMAPMTRSFSPGNVPNDDNVAYYERRAKNDVGLIITEGTNTGHKASAGYPNVPLFEGEAALAGWKRVVDAVHAQGGAIVPQLWHVGSVRRGEFPPDPSAPAHSPSGLFRPGKFNGVAMTQQDIDEAIASFVDGAASAQTLGFDGVEIHGAHGYLLDQFFWAGTNERTDKYGGDLVQRTRFAVEMITAIRERVGPNFPIILRFSQWKLQDYYVKLAETPQELEAFLEPLTDAGVDIFHCSTRRFWEPEFEGSTLNLAGWTKLLTGKPTITVGSVSLNAGFIDEAERGMIKASGVDAGTIANLYERLENDEFDLVAVGRALLQDPTWVLKVRDGRLDELEDYSQESLKQLV
ncbi:MAG: NADH:flavin oxidoreductase [Chloroflexota bacterium]